MRKLVGTEHHALKRFRERFNRRDFNFMSRYNIVFLYDRTFEMCLNANLGYRLFYLGDKSIYLVNPHKEVPRVYAVWNNEKDLLVTVINEDMFKSREDGYKKYEKIVLDKEICGITGGYFKGMDKYSKNIHIKIKRKKGRKLILP